MTSSLFGKGGTKHIMNRFKITSLIVILVILLTALGVRSVSTKAASTTNCSWQVVPSPNAFNGTGGFNGAAAFSSSDVWAVGSSAGGALTEHWDGTDWSVVPNLVSNGRLYAATTVPGTNQAWSLGSYNNSIGEFPLIEQWNGTTAWWNVVSSPNTGSNENALLGVTAVSGNDAWAVGYSGSVGASAVPLIEHWNGTSWSIAHTPTGTGVLRGVIALAANDIWAVGENDSSYEYASIEQWDGTSWSIIPSPQVQGRLFSVAQVAGTNQLWAVGDGSTGTLIEHWDGSSWSVVASPTIGTHDDLFGVVALSTTNAWAVGDHFSKLPEHTLIEHWDGLSWHNVINSNIATFSAITRIPGTNRLWTVGTIAGSNRADDLGTFTEFHC